MRVLVQSVFYTPETIGVAKYTSELCEFLTQQGHEVRVVCPPPYYPRWRVQAGYSGWRFSRETIAGVEIFRCPIYVPANPTLVTRVLHDLSFAVSSFAVVLGMTSWRPSIVFVVEPSILNSFSAILICKLTRATSWLHIQDFELDIALAMSKLGGRSLHRAAHAIEAFFMRRFDVISTISNCMLAHLTSKRVDPMRCRPLPNWVDTDAVFPQSTSPMRKLLGISPGKIVCLFSGSMGAKQDVEIIIEAARLLVCRTELEFIVCGEGGAADAIKAAATGLPNVRFLPLQPSSEFNDLLSICDIHLLPQKATAQDLVMPSKLLGMTASGRPVIATVNAGSEIADVIATFGVISPPGDAAAFARAIETLAEDSHKRARLGNAAREYALHHFDKNRILGAFGKSLQSLTRAA